MKKCKMRRINLYFVLLFIGGIGCKKMLEESNPSAITIENYFQTASQAEASINGIYPMLQTFANTTGRAGEMVWASIEMPVGHSNTQIVYNSDLINHRSASFDPVFRILWQAFYKGIANANVAIERIPMVEMSEIRKKSLLGEARFLRAFYYYYLVRLYGDIPLIAETITFSSFNLYPERSPIEKIYDLIITDLKEAEMSGLPPVDRTGRVSLGAVKSLLASVYLTMAGHPLNKGAEFFKLAADKAEEVIDSNWYNLFTDYKHLHDRAHKNQEEFILQAQYLAGVQSSNITQYITPAGKNISSLGRGWGSIIPRNEFLESYETNDKRAKEGQFYFTKYSQWGNPTIIEEFGGFALYKFWLEEAAGPNGDVVEDQNWTLLRLPEVILIYAEASNEVNGPTQKAYQQINLIRSRAELSPLEDLTKDEFREAIWRERYHELSFENKAYFDIQRTHMAFNLGNRKFEDIFSFENESGVTFNQQYLLWPIPQSEIDANSKLSQNLGW
ncbi:MAG: RagB/SusD family nutrient uptake outer membrane protein [Chitinophagaceae bacterium]|nr:RagB/SusD family nutrient uptake outer membrane protein [Chitinophagaceae bacterium]